MPKLLPMSTLRGSGDGGEGSALAAVLLAVTVVAALYFGREVLVPIALAVLMSFVLAPLVRLLQRWYIPRALAVIVTVLIASAGVFGLGALMVFQVNQLATDLPQYQATLQEKVRHLRGTAGSSKTLERASEVLQDLGKELERPGGARVSVERSAPAKPIEVEIKQPDPTALQTLGALITPLLPPLATAGIVLIFVIFILMQKQDLRNKLVRLAGSHDIQRTTAALDDTGYRLSRMFLTQLALNAGFGLVIGAGLWVIGVPSAPLWGIFAMILRFVPYVGAPIAAIFPLIMAAAVGPGWAMVVWTAALFLIVEPIVGHVIEPMLYGHSTGLSPIAVVAAATFWTWLWGPIGLILATPLTICLVVLGRHVDRLQFLEVVFSDQPALTPAELVYQRMLAQDPDEAAEQAQRFLKDKPLIAYYDGVLLEGLKLAQADAERGLLDEARMLRIRDAIAEIVDDLSSHTDKSVPDSEGASEEEAPLAQIEKAEQRAGSAVAEIPEQWRTGTPVLCVPGVGLLDEGIAVILAQLLQRRGIGARAEQAGTLSMSRIFSLDTEDVALLCVCYVENASPAQIRYALRRIRRKAPEARILVALLGNADKVADLEGPDAFQEAELVKQSLSATVDRILAIITRGSHVETALPSPAPLAKTG